MTIFRDNVEDNEDDNNEHDDEDDDDGNGQIPVASCVK
jgi:hypothetical protein